jgi:mandelate racemase
VTPTCHFLEYVDWADKIVQEPLQIVEGAAIVRDQPGNGLLWDADAVQHYRLP